MYYQNILQTIGNTPLIQLHKVIAGIPALVLLKNETFNPGHSIKDRMALKMLEDAEADGRIAPGGTIIECTSGNTGMGLAIAAAVKGYHCIFTTTDKQSKEKIDLLKALGAEVIVCPTNVSADDPNSYYSVAGRLSREIPNSFWANQYDNLSNRQAHYESTGPEIWAQTEGKVTHLVAGVGTGGTISGTGRFLKEKNPNIQVWGIDTYGSALKKYHETGILDEKEIYPYITEGIGEDIIPQNVDFSIIDHFEKVTDQDGAIMARRLAREEGMLLGYSAGSAVAGLLQLKDRLTPDDVVVVVIHDHGSRYVGKIFNDEWMRDRGFLDTEMRVRDVLAKKSDRQFLCIHEHETLQSALEMLKQHEISQIPVMRGKEMVGSITENGVLAHLLSNPVENAQHTVGQIMGAPFPIVSADLRLHELSKYLDKRVPAVLVQERSGAFQILTQYDLLKVF